MKCITILYPSQDNEGFSFEFYRDRHAPLIKSILGAAMHKIQVRKGMPGPDGALPKYVATINIWIADWDAYLKAMESRTQELIDELPFFTKAMPEIQIDEVYLEL